MAISYSWIIPQLECKPIENGRPNVVVLIHWRRQAANGSHIVETCGTQSLALDSSANFTNYSAITEQQTKDWLEKAMGPERMNEIDAHLAACIAERVEPSMVIQPLPWME